MIVQLYSHSSKVGGELIIYSKLFSMFHHHHYPPPFHEPLIASVRRAMITLLVWLAPPSPQEC